jgi:hypothetical protein
MNSKVFHEFRPFFLGIGFFFELEICVPGDVYQGLFDKPAHHSGVCSTAGDCCGSMTSLLNGFLEIFSEGVIGSVADGNFSVGVEAFPLFDNGVNIKNSF